MPLTPIDVQQKTFGTALRGYDLDEVDDFLDDVVTSLKDYEQRLRDAQDRISTLEMEMNDRGDAEGAIARALVTAQRSADSIIADARAEAEQIVAAAQTEVSAMTKAKDDERAEAESEIARIRGIVADLRSGLAELAGAVGANLDEADTTLNESTVLLENAEPAVAAPAEEYYEAEQPVPAWEQPAALEDLADYEEDADADSEDGSEDDADDSSDLDDEGDSDDSEDTSYDDSYDEDDDETPVRPWEVN